MAPKEPNRHQLSSKLSYNQKTPAFLQKFQNRMAGVPDEDELDDEFEDDGSGRPPIPRRPAIPERPDDDPGSADEDHGDEKPQVVVLKEGKHLTEREAENVRRKEKGLPPLPEVVDAVAAASNKASAPSSKERENITQNQASGLSFSSSKRGFKSSTGKRKAVGDPDDPKEKKAANGSTKKKAKKASKTLLSFGDDA
ncbi:hypothetical protein Hypma_006407 [Hypsizygus marmoreus]|uniref:DUF4604 domain-containing protein n=1 Tax=Hypsizygus marmoreus TaxID=39966 RepID=A0A369JY00_HYPMA|nr:hypothetical protein Hypma_006407 [Hypsizygus marmoreus]